MKRAPLLYNFTQWEPPDGIVETLALLGLRSSWDGETRRHLIWQDPEVVPPRYPWQRREFKGGTQNEWTQFLIKITSAGWSV